MPSQYGCKCLLLILEWMGRRGRGLEATTPGVVQKAHKSSPWITLDALKFIYENDDSMHRFNRITLNLFLKLYTLERRTKKTTHTYIIIGNYLNCWCNYSICRLEIDGFNLWYIVIIVQFYGLHMNMLSLIAILYFGKLLKMFYLQSFQSSKEAA